MEEDADAIAMAEESTEQQAAACKKPARLHLHRSFLRLSRALKKLHARRGLGHQAANAGGSEPPPTPSSSSAAASFLSGCMHHPRTHSFASARRHKHEDALAVNFRSLRIGSTTATVVANESSSSSASSSPQLDHYCSDGGREREGVAPPPPPPPAALAGKALVGGAGVAVVTFSAAPYEDFRRSMREMVDDAAGDGAAAPAVDWGFMEELLFCYLRLNDRAVHGDILRAFTATVAALRRRRRRRAAAKGRRARRRGAGAAGSSGDGDVEAAAPL
ncbi:hypothetical protein C2845_PM03G32570 [Panicum miliaceum]|uniref:Transcription repressor n=1 Tax=Panicum miliaceum TaxID=4540 RepID=A0A3L6TAT8_PANMI|nr:hypothetical protein C2845_PM03G32570 [Panicum miliaceum]